MTTEKQTSSPYSSRSCEPVVMINGHRLTEGQATTLRVAIQSFDAFSGDDAFGKELSAAYEARTREIISLIFASPASPENHTIMDDEHIERHDLANLIKTRLINVHPDDQDLELEDEDWIRICAALTEDRA